ncbi:MAG: site-specific integrase [bacterium]|nr:site-specific integrase [bacterium]
MASIKIGLDTRKSSQKKDGSYPIVMKVHHQQSTQRINLKLSCQKREWNESKTRLKSGVDYTLVNARIHSYLKKANSYLSQNVFEVDAMTPIELKKTIQVEIFSSSDVSQIKKDIRVERKINGTSLTEFALLKSERLRMSKKNGYADNIEQSIERLHKFSGRTNLLFADVDLAFLKNFTAYCYGRGNKPNTIGVYLRPIKALFNEAIEEGHLKKGMNPFDGKFKIPKSKTKNRALSREDIHAFRNVKLKKGSADWNAQAYFLFMFNCRGMNFIDLVKLRKDQLTDLEYDDSGNLVGGYFTYWRTKLGEKTMLSVKLTKEAAGILDHFLNLNSNGPFVFPNGYEESEAGRKRYKQQRKRLNKRLREIAKDAGIVNTEVTTYYARHSWATLASQGNMPINMIKQGLGHTNINTTQIYIDSFRNEDLDDANDKIVA